MRWELKGDQVEITLDAKIREDQYVAFGLSGAPDNSQMVIKFTGKINQNNVMFTALSPICDCKSYA